MTSYANKFNPFLQPPTEPSRPPDVTADEWRRYVMRVIAMARSVRNLQDIPPHALDHMREVLLGK
ncbi:MAG TPA: hypothetical protein VNT52_00830 [Acidimicrobiales bacterium]|nr:hypothetical protein [Acidimicrobiales bacterium]